MDQAGTDVIPVEPRFRHVLAWLVVPAALSTVLYIVAGRLGPPEYRGDSSTYMRIADEGVFTTEALESTRTLAYPAFLKSVRAVCGSLAPVPWLHWAAFCGAIALFAYAVFSMAGSVPLCVGVTSPLFFSDIAAGYLPIVLTEVPATALALAAIASLVLAACEPDRRRWWIVLAVTVFLSYQFRPAFLFLVGIIPVLGVLIYPLVRDVGRCKASVWGVALRGTLAVGLPYCGFCLVRLILVGHFGLVSVAGTNVVGITGTLLEEEMLPELSADVRPLAARILQIRSSSELAPLQQEIGATWANALDRKAGLVIPLYEPIERLYNSTLRAVALPAAREIYGADRLAIDRAFSKLSLEVIALRPMTYIAWIGIAFYEAVVTGLTLYLMLGLWTLMACIFLLSRFVALASRGRKWLPSGQFTLREDERRVFSVVATIAIVFFCAKTLLVAAVEPTIPRYVRPAAIFLSMIPAMVIYCQVRYWFSVRSSGTIQTAEPLESGGPHLPVTAPPAQAA